MKEKPKLSRHLLMVTWQDAISDGGWTPKKEVKEMLPLILSVGWLVRKTRQVVILHADAGRDDEDTNRRVEIPRSLIREIVEIQLPEVPDAEAKA